MTAQLSREELKQSLIECTQNASGMFEVGEDAMCAMMALLAGMDSEPVAVHDELAGKSFEYIANKFQVSISEAQWILVGWNACRAAMQAEPVTSATVPDGWKLVPVEPTVAMTEALWDEIHESRDMNKAYRAMLSASPAAPEQEV